MDEFVGKVALITGAGGGIGREIARAFSSLGVSVALTDINPINLDETVRQITLSAGTARGYVFDIAKRMPIEGLVAQVLENFGRIDILVNHAFVHPDAGLLDMDEWEFHRTLDVNLAGPFFLMQQVGRVMRQQGGGAMVNTAYTHAQIHVPKGRAAYLASQAGLIGLNHAAANELSNFNIRVNAVCNAPVEADLVPGQVWELPMLHDWMMSYPQVQLGDHPLLVGLTLFLCSNASGSTTGQVFVVGPAQ